MYATNSLQLKLSCIFCCVALLSGCASYHAPKGWLPERTYVEQEPYGGWLYVEANRNGMQKMADGEFIGTSDESLLLLNENGLTRVPLDLISYASLKLHDDDRSNFAIWTALGAISTISNGWLLAITAPLWIISGSIITGSETYSGFYEARPPRSIWWRTTTMYSRFPQGIPPGLDVDKLRPKSGLVYRRN